LKGLVLKNPVHIFKDVVRGLNLSNHEGAESFLYKRENVKKMFNRMQGVYLLYSQQGDLLYVGKSLQVKSRVIAHLSYKTNTSVFVDFVHYVGFIFTDKCRTLYPDDLEQQLIDYYNPIFNGTGNRDRRYCDALSSDLFLNNPKVRQDVIKELILNFRKEQGLHNREISLYGETVFSATDIVNKIIGTAV